MNENNTKVVINQIYAKYTPKFTWFLNMVSSQIKSIFINIAQYHKFASGGFKYVFFYPTVLYKKEMKELLRLQIFDSVVHTWKTKNEMLKIFNMSLSLAGSCLLKTLIDWTCVNWCAWCWLKFFLTLTCRHNPPIVGCGDVHCCTWKNTRQVQVQGTPWAHKNLLRNHKVFIMTEVFRCV